MIVMAIEKGYFGGRLYNPGETFEIQTKGQLSSVWMKEITEADGKRGRAKPAVPVIVADQAPTIVVPDPDSVEKIRLANELSGRDDITDLAEAMKILTQAGGE